MIQSMTGYGEATLHNIHCEIKTLNHRFFDVTLSIPSNLSSYEFEIRNLLSARIKRGAVSLKIFIEDRQIKPDIEGAKTYYNFVKELKQELGLRGGIPIEPFLSFKKEEVPSRQHVKAVIESALRKLLKSRIEEGKKLQSDIKLHLRVIKELIKAIKQKAPKQEEMEKQFREKLASFQKNELDERKVKEESTLLLIRENFNEEQVRFEAHLHEFNRILKSKEPSGKHLSFLIQEMQREANTISSKAKNAEISQLVVELKRELEILREQVGNAR